MRDFGSDFGLDFGPPNGRVAAQAQLRQNVPITSPVATTVLVGTSSVQVLGFNPVRRGVIFMNPGSVNIYIVPSNRGAIAGHGLLVLPGAQLPFDADPGANILFTSGWNAVAATGSSNPLTVLELL